MFPLGVGVPLHEDHGTAKGFRCRLSQSFEKDGDVAFCSLCLVWGLF